jgi:hypothetical protein
MPVNEPAGVFEETPSETASIGEDPPAWTVAPVEEAPAAPRRRYGQDSELPVDISSEEERRLHNDARRFARLLISADTENDSDVLAITGASASLAISTIPFQKTVAGVRVGLVDGKYVINPTYSERKTSKIDLVVAGSADAIMMVEAGAKQATEDEMVGALDAAHAAIKVIVAQIDDLKREVGKPKKAVNGEP